MEIPGVKAARWSMFAAAITVWLLAGCQSSSVSLKEAEEIALDFDSASFTPPPKKITDLYSMLLVPQVAPTEQLGPDCAGEDDGKWVSRFKEYQSYYQPYEKIDQESTSTGRWNINYAWQLPKGIAIMEIRRGNLPEAIAAFKDYLSKIPDRKKGAKIAAYAQYAVMLAGLGDLEAAEDALSNAEFWEDQARNRRPDIIPFHDHWLFHAKGAIAEGRGRLREAEAYYRESLRNIEIAKWYSPEVGLKHGLLAGVLAGQGRLLEAENEARLGIKHNLDNARKAQVVTASIIYRLARILLDQGRSAEAERVAASAVWTYQLSCMPGQSVEFAEARRALAEAYASEGRYDEALGLFSAIRDAMGQGSKSLSIRFDGDLTWTYALIRAGHTGEARGRLQKALARLRDTHGEQHPKIAESLGFLAMVEAKDGNQAQAETLYRQAVDVLQDPRQRTGVRPNNLRLVIEGYLDFLKDRARHDRQAADTMFRLVEILRGSTVQEAVASMGSRAAAGTPELAKLLRKAQDARARLAALEVTYSNALVTGVRAEQIKSDIERLKLALEALQSEVNKRFPDYAELAQPKPASLELVQGLLQQHEALIATYVGEQESYVWAIDGNGKFAFAPIGLGRDALTAEVKALRKAMAPTGPKLSDIPDFDVARAYRLYAKLLKPVAAGWKDSDSLMVVAHGPLGYLPFGALPTEQVELGSKRQPLFARYRDVPWLIKERAVASLPSASSLQSLRRLAKAPAGRKPMIGFGDPWFNPEQLKQAQVAAVTMRGAGQMSFRAAPAIKDLNSATIADLPRLPDTADELRDIARAIGADPNKDLRLGKQANEQAVKSADLTGYRTVVFATHGLVPGELDGLTQPALALSAPAVAGVDGDGLLTMDEVMGLNLNADWVVLSACNTGSGEGAGAEAVSGLGRAFFYAGARSLLVSNWPVETTSARRLTSGIFAHQLEGRSAALRTSMLDLLDNGTYQNPKTGKAVFAYAHPIFWAPFTLMGDGARGH